MRLLQQVNGNLPRTEEEKELMIKNAAEHYGKYLEALGFDWEKDPQTTDTPLRVAKAWVNDIIKGSISREPVITSFDNSDGYEGMVVQTKIPVKSLCAHHNLPITGVAHVAYIPSKEGKVIGLSKLNRSVSFFAHRPNLQESLTKQIHDFIDKKCENNIGVAVLISASHLCTCHRGVFNDSVMNTMQVSGCFFSNQRGAKDEFMKHIELTK